ncbi:TadE/TadG family type IV pilus assembly protein [Streptomonospora salina]|uniref:Flp pilus assembly protein TadG n=1 Tax=Streptomonospora salina TaxID=104205 RepID=A0A841E8E5_9ACTN|nr:pilus assembly protein TadG-related protein [Streptomonospora salina]MBB5998754.1 Flp pilus assembly protein TadG [Streptomonospora salina]
MIRRLPQDDGQTTVFVAVAVIALLLMGGLIIDGGAQLRAAQRATSAAEEAARAGNQAVDIAQLLQTGEVHMDTADAVSAANAYLDAAGADGNARAASANTVTVEVHEHVDTVLLSLIGIDSLSATGSATARLATEEPQ